MNYAFEPKPFDAALEFWKSKVQVDASEFISLSAVARLRAFSVSTLAKGAMLDSVYQAMQKQMEGKVSFAQFKQDIAPLIERKGWTGPKAWRINNLYRTNLQTAYQVGRYQQMHANATNRPYWMYDAVMDGSTRPTHAAQHGKVYPHDHAYWDTWYPPNGFQCRCSVRTLSARQVEARGLKVETIDPTNKLIEPVDPVTGVKLPARHMLPDPGFATNPGKSWLEFEHIVWQQSSSWPKALRDAMVTAMAGTTLRQKVFDAAVDVVAAEKKAHGVLTSVGWFDTAVLDALEQIKPPETPVIYTNDKQILHALRDTKKSKLSVAELKQMPEAVRRYKAVLFDVEKENVLIVKDLPGDTLSKYVVAIDYNLKKTGKVNLVITAGKIHKNDLNNPKYKLLAGSLED